MQDEKVTPIKQNMIKGAKRRRGSQGSGTTTAAEIIQARPFNRSHDADVYYNVVPYPIRINWIIITFRVHKFQMAFRHERDVKNMKGYSGSKKWVRDNKKKNVTWEQQLFSHLIFWHFIEITRLFVKRKWSERERRVSRQVS